MTARTALASFALALAASTMLVPLPASADDIQAPIVVAQADRGQGWGRRLYDDLFRHARQLGVGTITCEFDVEPPNPVSERFHRAFGFREVGRQRYGTANKLVSLQADITTPLSPKLLTHWLMRTAGVAELPSEAMHAADTDGSGPLPPGPDVQ